MKLQTKLFFYSVALAVLVIGLLDFLYINYSIKELKNQLLRRGLLVTYGMARNGLYGVVTRDEVILNNFVKSAMKEKDVEGVMILDEDGKVLTAHDPGVVGEAVDKVKKLSFTGADDIDIHEEKHWGGYEIIAPIFDEGADRALDEFDFLGEGASTEREERKEPKLAGYVLVKITMKYLYQRIVDLHRLVFLISLGVVVLSSVLGIVLSSQIIRPILDLTVVTGKVARGDLTQKVESGANDEIGELSRSFNKMMRELKTSHDELRKLSLAVEQTSDAVIITDPQGSIEYVNPRFVELTGYAPEEVIGKNPRLLKSGKTSAEEYAQMWSRIQSGQKWTGELYNLKKNGEYFWVYTTISPIVDAQNTIIHFVSEGMDITDRKLAEEKIKRALAIKADFITTVSHELRTPLTISKEALALLVRQKTGELNPQQLEVATIASANIDRLSMLINDILDLSKIESGKMELQKEVVDITRVIKECCDGWKLKANNKNITFELNLPQQAVYTNIDVARLLQVLSNLLSNAIKFTLMNGKVTVSLKEYTDSVDCIIADTGIGIAKEDMPKLFEKFQQFRRTYGPGAKGTGLGLSLVKSLVEAHGGKVNAVSEVGKGSTFFIRLPKG